jgi:diguanylate cyclase (GGDEF)-like protein
MTLRKKNNNIRVLKFQPKPKSTRKRLDPSAAQNLNRGLLSLYHASNELHLTKPLPALLKSILRGLKTGTGISKAVIFLYEEADQLLAGTASVGLSESKISAMKINVQREEVSDLIKLHEKGLSAKSSTPIQNYWARTFQSELGFKTVQIMPLEIRDHLVGLLVFEVPPRVAPAHEILIIFARQTALTIENARLFAQVEQMAVRDTLTGLYNRRYFQQILDYELNRAKRYQQALSIIFIDLDHFKQVNDRFGHSMGDLFLKQISEKLAGMFRTTDLVARYAGDEFVAILPATQQEGAMILAHRIQETLGDYQIMVRGTTLQVSVSIGVDTYENTDGIGSITLIDRADKAMYEAKSKGRNCVRNYQEVEKALVKQG